LNNKSTKLVAIPMVKLKNYNLRLKHIVIFLTFIFFVSCAEQKNYVSKVEGKKLPVTEKISQNNDIDNFIKPYRDKIDQDMREVLAFNPETLDKSGVWQSNIGNLISDVTLQRGNLVYNKRYLYAKSWRNSIYSSERKCYHENGFSDNAF
jgi:2',3'-cyclic-nucleotide 2'-phosphodiesterase (5'-nucleotidase family)